MAETSESEVAPQTNGIQENELDEDDKSKMRPVEIDADMREMERRKRVEMIMSSRLFREELERIIESQMKEGGGPAGLLQQIQDMVGGRVQPGHMFRSTNCVVPINDIRGVESMGYAKGEKILRCKLAAVYRLMDLYGWTQGIHNHITARLNQDDEHFLVNAYGMLYHEVTASSLVKVDMQGAIVESGTTNFGVNVPSFQLHAAVHAARPDIKCVIHIHTPSVLAVSSLKCGLLPLCQESAVIGEVSQHPYLGTVSEPEEKDKIARNLGPINKVMFLSNHGAVCCGETIEEAFFNVYNTVLACETQMKLIPLGVDNLQLLPDETRKQIYDAARRAPEGINVPHPAAMQLPQALEKKEKRWRIGGLEFEALMRMLDNAGFRTGYIYRTPLIRGEPPRPRNDVEVPPAVSSLGYLLEEEEMYRQGNWKKMVDGRSRNDRTRWLNSPNVYQKVEILETGTPDPKKITKWVDAANADEWVAEGSPTHSSTPVRIDAALQFVPKNTNPREFKRVQKQIKENRRADKITSGPQSHILEGVSWEDAKKLQDANISVTGDQVILVGAASKGIIQREYQHNATVYKTPYAKNPFEAVSDQELEDYKKVITRKQRGESYDEDQSESEALSSSAALPPTGMKSPPSETEDESRTADIVDSVEPRVLRIETKTAPVPSQAEIVLSDVIDDLPQPHFERFKSERRPSSKVADTKVNRSSSLDRPKSNAKGKGARGIREPPQVFVVQHDELPTPQKASLQIVMLTEDDKRTRSFVSRACQTNLVIYDLSDKFSCDSPPVYNPLPPTEIRPDPLSQMRSNLMEELRKELESRFKGDNNNNNANTCLEEETIIPIPQKKFKKTVEYFKDFSSDEESISSIRESSESEPVKDRKEQPDSLQSCTGSEFENEESLTDDPTIPMENLKEGYKLSIEAGCEDTFSPERGDEDSSILGSEGYQRFIVSQRIAFEIFNRPSDLTGISMSSSSTLLVSEDSFTDEKWNTFENLIFSDDSLETSSENDIKSDHYFNGNNTVNEPNESDKIKEEIIQCDNVLELGSDSQLKEAVEQEVTSFDDVDKIENPFINEAARFEEIKCYDDSDCNIDVNRKKNSDYESGVNGKSDFDTIDPIKELLKQVKSDNNEVEKQSNTKSKEVVKLESISNDESCKQRKGHFKTSDNVKKPNLDNRIIVCSNTLQLKEVVQVETVSNEDSIKSLDPCINEAGREEKIQYSDDNRSNEKSSLGKSEKINLDNNEYKHDNNYRLATLETIPKDDSIKLWTRSSMCGSKDQNVIEYYEDSGGNIKQCKMLFDCGIECLPKFGPNENTKNMGSSDFTDLQGVIQDDGDVKCFEQAFARDCVLKETSLDSRMAGLGNFEPSETEKPERPSYDRIKCLGSVIPKQVVRMDYIKKSFNLNVEMLGSSQEDLILVLNRKEVEVTTPNKGENEVDCSSDVGKSSHCDTNESPEPELLAFLIDDAEECSRGDVHLQSKMAGEEKNNCFEMSEAKKCHISPEQGLVVVHQRKPDSTESEDNTELYPGLKDVQIIEAKQSPNSHVSSSGTARSQETYSDYGGKFILEQDSVENTNEACLEPNNTINVLSANMMISGKQGPNFQDESFDVKIGSVTWSINCLDPDIDISDQSKRKELISTTLGNVEMGEKLPSDLLGKHHIFKRSGTKSKKRLKSVSKPICPWKSVPSLPVIRRCNFKKVHISEKPKTLDSNVYLPFCFKKDSHPKSVPRDYRSFFSPPPKRDRGPLVKTVEFIIQLINEIVDNCTNRGLAENINDSLTNSSSSGIFGSGKISPKELLMLGNNSSNRFENNYNYVDDSGYEADNDHTLLDVCPRLFAEFTTDSPNSWKVVQGVGNTVKTKNHVENTTKNLLCSKSNEIVNLPSGIDVGANVELDTFLRPISPTQYCPTELVEMNFESIHRLSSLSSLQEFLRLEAECNNNNFSVGEQNIFNLDRNVSFSSPNLIEIDDNRVMCSFYRDRKNLRRDTLYRSIPEFMILTMTCKDTELNSLPLNNVPVKTIGSASVVQCNTEDEQVNAQHIADSISSPEPEEDNRPDANPQNTQELPVIEDIQTLGYLLCDTDESVGSFYKEIETRKFREEPNAAELTLSIQECGWLWEESNEPFCNIETSKNGLEQVIIEQSIELNKINEYINGKRCFSNQKYCSIVEGKEDGVKNINVCQTSDKKENFKLDNTELQNTQTIVSQEIILGNVISPQAMDSEQSKNCELFQIPQIKLGESVSTEFTGCPNGSIIMGECLESNICRIGKCSSPYTDKPSPADFVQLGDNLKSDDYIEMTSPVSISCIPFIEIRDTYFKRVVENVKDPAECGNSHKGEFVKHCEPLANFENSPYGKHQVEYNGNQVCKRYNISTCMKNSSSSHNKNEAYCGYGFDERAPNICGSSLRTSLQFSDNPNSVVKPEEFIGKKEIDVAATITTNNKNLEGFIYDEEILKCSQPGGQGSLSPADEPSVPLEQFDTEPSVFNSVESFIKQTPWEVIANGASTEDTLDQYDSPVESSPIEKAKCSESTPIKRSEIKQFKEAASLGGNRSSICGESTIEDVDSVSFETFSSMLREGPSSDTSQTYDWSSVSWTTIPSDSWIGSVSENTRDNSIDVSSASALLSDGEARTSFIEEGSICPVLNVRHLYTIEECISDVSIEL